MNTSRSITGSIARAWRSLTRRPAYFAIAVSSLAIALGLATTVIAQIDSLLHPYTPIRNVDNVVGVRAGGMGKTGMPSRADALEALDQTGFFEKLVHVDVDVADVEIGQGIIRPYYVMIDAAFFDVLGIKPRMGRLFATNDTFESGGAVVSDKFWRAYFGNAPTLDGANFRIGDQPFRVIGVLDREWDPKGRGEPDALLANEGLWVPPKAYTPGVQRFSSHMFVARLKNGMRQSAVDSTLAQIATRWRNHYGEGRPRFEVSAQSMRPDPLRLRGFQRALIAAAIFILVIASANVGALTLARGVTNRRDQALRLALGAERRDLMRDVIAEIGILAAVGGAIGVLIAYASMGILTALTPVDLEWLGFTSPNWSVRVFAGLFAAVAVCVSLCAIGPAWFVSRIAPAEPLKDSSGTTTGRSTSRFQILIVGELALAMILLFGASLIGKTTHRISAFPFGYDPGNVVSFETFATVVDTLTPPSASAQRRRYRRPEILTGDLEGIVRRLRHMPGATNAAWYTITTAEKDIVLSEASAVIDSIVYKPRVYNTGADFFRTLGIRIVEGRDFTPGDAVSGAIILDQRSAQRLFPDGSPIGRRVKLGPLNSSVPWLPVVGVVRDAVHGLPVLPELDPETVIYVSHSVKGMRPSFVVRGDGSVRDMTPAGVATLKSILPPSSWVIGRKWSGLYESMLAGRRFTAGIFATLSLASLALATAGLFGVLSYAVGQRMREFSLRVALGAQKANLLRLVFRDSFVMALGGTAIGAFVGLYLGFEVWDWLWGVYPVDASALVIAEIVLLAVTFGASTIPALRATRANPADVMRSI